MQIVIDISEEEYAAILGNADIIRKRKKNTLEEAVLSGTPLPKGHGRLIDADALGEKEKCYLNEDESISFFYVYSEDIIYAPTIIESN